VGQQVTSVAAGRPEVGVEPAEGTAASGIDRVLVVNAGSSSLKLRVLDRSDRVVAAADLGAVRNAADSAQVADAVSDFGRIDAIGHRIVHGGTAFRGPVRIDAGVVARITALTDLAPLHQPKSLAALEAVTAVFPDHPAVACFDTAFHATLPPEASTYALPAPWRSRWDLRRYGFHGLSHAYAARRTVELLGVPEQGLRVITCHLGAGASLAAVRDGRSIDTTMGFTPLEGLVMATRSGSVDPGLVLWLAEHVGMPPAELAATLERRSGLLGLAGTADMRVILERAHAGDGDAALALEVYLHRLRASIAAMTASLGGLDAIVFTGGVGERSPEIREAAARGLGYLGIEVDRDRNRGPGDKPNGGEGASESDDREIGRAGARVRALVIAAREDVEIARQVRTVLAP
jgi:acetate kinase